jgi:hypothetical protein
MSKYYLISTHHGEVVTGSNQEMRGLVYDCGAEILAKTEIDGGLCVGTLDDLERRDYKLAVDYFKNWAKEQNISINIAGI